MISTPLLLLVIAYFAAVKLYHDKKILSPNHTNAEMAEGKVRIGPNWYDPMFTNDDALINSRERVNPDEWNTLANTNHMKKVNNLRREAKFNEIPKALDTRFQRYLSHGVDPDPSGLAMYSK